MNDLSRPKPYVMPREWIAAFLAGLEQSSFTGHVDIRIDFNKGGITRLVPLKQEVIEPPQL